MSNIFYEVKHKDSDETIAYFVNEDDAKTYCFRYNFIESGIVPYSELVYYKKVRIYHDGIDKFEVE